MEMEKVCRICLEGNEILLDLFEDTGLVEKIETISSLKFVPNDKFASKICTQCIDLTELAYSFRFLMLKNMEALDENLTKEVEFSSDDVFLEELNLDNDINLREVSDVYFEMEEEGQVAQEEEEKEEEEEEEEMEEIVFNCTFCDFSTSQAKIFQRHSRNHVTVVCSVCGKQIRQTSYRVHLKTHEDSPVNCHICGKLSKNAESLRFHLISHRNQKYLCAECGKCYKHASGYRNHIRQHQPGYTKNARCETCGKHFYEQRFLVKHMRSHTGEKPYECHYCFNKFSSSYALKTHIRRHTNEKPYKCEHCFAAFYQKVSLKTHLTSKHSQVSKLV